MNLQDEKMAAVNQWINVGQQDETTEAAHVVCSILNVPAHLRAVRCLKSEKVWDDDLLLREVEMDDKWKEELEWMSAETSEEGVF